MSKTVVITGAGGVLCSRLAEALAENGHKIAVLDLRMEAADSVVARIKANGGTAIGVEANVLEKDNLIRAKKKVNNAVEFCLLNFPKIGIKNKANKANL